MADGDEAYLANGCVSTHYLGFGAASELARDQISYFSVDLPHAIDDEQCGDERFLAIRLHTLGPKDRAHLTSLVFERHEQHAFWCCQPPLDRDQSGRTRELSAAQHRHEPEVCHV